MARFSCPLGGAEILFFCLWLTGCQAVWRYRTSVENYILFTTSTTIYLEYEGTSFVEWNAPAFCTIADKSSPRTTLNCPVAGVQKIKPEVQILTFEDMERYLTINVELNCFLWYVQPTNQRDT
ncbi:cation channel sperm-associated protein subunit epsilon-like protein [Heteronotia binoei]|uniref:cation channel sperm-associated protein subunit epsilon-like protein n=1 Tax=Heteronotia binoei TaxID=13085 RepID=UPI00292E651D|nr:cation channel sperm-associated protein subunit epsilon-like protein [Heteronotia binoei]